MNEQRKINIATQLIKEIEEIPNVDFLVNNRKQRQELASLYKQVMNIGKNFPETPRTMTNHTPSILYKKVSRTCPSCVKPAIMKKYVTQAKEVLVQYSQILTKWLGTGDIDSDKDIHDLRPNI